MKLLSLLTLVSSIGCIHSSFAKAEDSETCYIKFRTFYSWAYPTKIIKPEYSLNFTAELQPKSYNWTSSIEQNQAYLDSVKRLQPGLQPAFFDLEEIPLDTIIAFRVLNERTQFINDSDAVLNQIRDEFKASSNNLSSKERLILARDLWQVISAVRSWMRMWDRASYKADFLKLEEINRVLVGVFDSEFGGRTQDLVIPREVEFSDIVNSLELDEHKVFFRHIALNPDFKEVKFESKWIHNIAFNGASLFRIFTCTDKSSSVAILVRVAWIPKSPELDVIFPTELIEEIFVAGTSTKPSFAENSGSQPWRLHFKLNRNLLSNLNVESTSTCQNLASYVRLIKPDSSVFVGYSSDAPGAMRGGKTVLTSRVSCIECHGGVGPSNKLEMSHQSGDMYGEAPSLRFANVEGSEAFKIDYFRFFNKEGLPEEK